MAINFSFINRNLDCRSNLKAAFTNSKKLVLEYESFTLVLKEKTVI